MAAHRYWRARSFEAYGAGDLEIGEFHLLLSGARVDATASLSATIAPNTGLVENLQDDDLLTPASWSASNAKTLALVWDFGGSPSEVDDIRIGAAQSQVTFPLILRLQWSDDAVTWSEFAVIAGIAWPGAKSKTTSRPGSIDEHYGSTVLLIHGDTDGISDASSYGKTIQVNGGVAVVSTAGDIGDGCLSFDGVSDWLQVADSDTWSFGSKNWTIEFFGRDLANVDAAAGIVIGQADGLGASSASWAISTSGGAISFNASTGTGAWNIASTAAIGTGVDGTVRKHVALSCEYPTLRIFIDGVLFTTYTLLAPMPDSAWPLTIGDSSGVSKDNGMAGKLDEIRITNGVSRYNSAFTAPVLPFSGGVALNSIKGRAAPSGTIHIGSSAYTGPYGVVSVGQVPPVGRNDYLTGVLGQGIGRVTGTVKNTGTPDTPVYRKVRLIRERDGLVIREAWSDPVTGAYDFQYVDELQIYTVMSFDHTGNYRGVVADRLTPELMP